MPKIQYHEHSMNYKKILIPVVIVLLLICCVCGGIGTWYAVRLSNLQSNVSKAYDTNSTIVKEVDDLKASLDDLSSLTATSSTNKSDTVLTAIKDVEDKISAVEKTRMGYDEVLPSLDNSETKDFYVALKDYNDSMKSSLSDLQDIFGFMDKLYTELQSFEDASNKFSDASKSGSTTAIIQGFKDYSKSIKEVSPRIKALETNVDVFVTFRDKFSQFLDKFAAVIDKMVIALESNDYTAYQDASYDLATLSAGEDLSGDIEKGLLDQYQSKFEDLTAKEKTVGDAYDKLPTYLKKTK